MQSLALGSRALLLFALAALSACASGPPPAKEGTAAPDSSLKAAALQRELPIAREKATKSRRDLEDQEVAGKGAMDKAKAELNQAQARLKNFDDKESPLRLSRGRLSLQEARDREADAKEEMEQLELMYREQDLADKTKEIVIRRGKRQLERSQEYLKLQDDELQTLAERTLPLEREKLALDVDDKQRELDRATRAAASGIQEKRIAMLAAEAEIERIEAELAPLIQEGK